VKRLPVFLFLFMAACSERTEIPSDILPPDSVRGILKDMIIAEHYSEQYISKDSLVPDKKKARQQLLDAIFKLHHTTREEFKKSLSFYESRPDMNKIIFDSLAVEANRRKTELYQPKAPPKPKTVPIK
jgi:hypothetical protein